MHPHIHSEQKIILCRKWFKKILTLLACDTVTVSPNFAIFRAIVFSTKHFGINLFSFFGVVTLPEVSFLISRYLFPTMFVSLSFPASSFRKLWLYQFRNIFTNYVTIFICCLAGEYILYYINIIIYVKFHYYRNIFGKWSRRCRLYIDSISTWYSSLASIWIDMLRTVRPQRRSDVLYTGCPSGNALPTRWRCWRSRSGCTSNHRISLN